MSSLSTFMLVQKKIWIRAYLRINYLLSKTNILTYGAGLESAENLFSWVRFFASINIWILFVSYCFIPCGFSLYSLVRLLALMCLLSFQLKIQIKYSSLRKWQLVFSDQSETKVRLFPKRENKTVNICHIVGLPYSKVILLFTIRTRNITFNWNSKNAEPV